MSHLGAKVVMRAHSIGMLEAREVQASKIIQEGL